MSQLKWGFFSCLDAQNGLTSLGKKFPCPGGVIYILESCKKTKQAGFNRALVERLFLVAALSQGFQKRLSTHQKLITRPGSRCQSSASPSMMWSMRDDKTSVRLARMPGNSARRKLRAAYMPDAARANFRVPPSCHQRFACARLSQ